MSFPSIGSRLSYFEYSINHVRRLLGHKGILNTQMYVNMEQAFFGVTSEDYTVKVASNVVEVCKLLEVGFEYVTESEGKKLFWKRNTLGNKGTCAF